MRKAITLSLLGLLAFAFQSSATVLVYKMSVRITEVGAGQNQSARGTGYFILDPDSASIVTVNVVASRKFYGVQVWKSCQIDTLRPRKGKKQTVITQARSWYDSADYPRMDTATIKGVNTPFRVTGILYDAPKRFSFNGTSVYGSATQDESILETDNGVFAYDAKSSDLCNGFDDTAEAAANRLKQKWAVLPGYTERFYE